MATLSTSHGQETCELLFLVWGFETRSRPVASSLPGTGLSGGRLLAKLCCLEWHGVCHANLGLYSFPQCHACSLTWELIALCEDAFRNWF